MAWRGRKIENILSKRLIDELGEDKGKELFGHYVDTRTKVVEQILPQIKTIENSLTDHSEDHIGDVLDKTEYLLNGSDFSVTAIDLYYLCMLGLFHDVGNIHGRSGHYDKAKILEIYDYAVGKFSKYQQEKMLIASGASAHSGKASDGTTDTMKELKNEKQGLHGEGINIRRLAPILRFADELCEGPQRTSDYMLLHHKYDKESEIHHRYAQITDIFIDRNRIAITYNINIQVDGGDFKMEIKSKLKELLTYTYKRIIKLNSERRYNKYYSDLLASFNETSVRINFLLDGYMPCDIGLSELTINDLRIPDNPEVQLTSIYPNYDIDKIIDGIESVNSEIKSAKV